jgi:hypothetical protein
MVDLFNILIFDVDTQRARLVLTKGVFFRHYLLSISDVPFLFCFGLTELNREFKNTSKKAIIAVASNSMSRHSSRTIPSEPPRQHAHHYGHRNFYL